MSLLNLIADLSVSDITNIIQAFCALTGAALTTFTLFTLVRGTKKDNVTKSSDTRISSVNDNSDISNNTGSTPSSTS